MNPKLKARIDEIEKRFMFFIEQRDVIFLISELRRAYEDIDSLKRRE